MELFALLVVIIVIYAMWRFNKSTGEVAMEVEDTVHMARMKSMADREEEVLILQQRMEALEQAHPNRIRFVDADSMFESKVKPAIKVKK